jgi:LDH2 family malate/lactate/ureidoglycolate dehydrogenase
MATTNEGTIPITPTSAHNLVHAILTSYSVPPAHAELVASALVLADLRGVDSHGINRLPSYIARLRNGALHPNPPLTFAMKTPVMASLDARNTFGFVAGCLAIDKGIEIASTYGLACVSVKHSNHYGMASTYLLRGIAKGFGVYAFTNASASLPPWGSKEALFGTSPFAVGLPGGKDGGDFVLDMSPSVAARGKIRKAARRGEEIPDGYALDEEGRPTNDPVAALKGTVLPIGGPKGSGIAMLMDIMGGLISGAAFAGGVKDMNKPGSEPQDVGHWFLVFRPEVFLDSKEEYESRMETLMQRVRNCEKMAGVERIYTSGEIEAEKEAKNRRDGIRYTRDEIAALHKLAEDAGSAVRLEEM